MTLQDKVYEHVRSAWGDNIRRDEGMRYDAHLDTHELDAFIDQQSTSWLLSTISLVLEEDEDDEG